MLAPYDAAQRRWGLWSRVCSRKDLLEAAKPGSRVLAEQELALCNLAL